MVTASIATSRGGRNGSLVTVKVGNEKVGVWSVEHVFERLAEKKRETGGSQARTGRCIYLKDQMEKEKTENTRKER